jgi:hypothetical protein
MRDLFTIHDLYIRKMICVWVAAVADTLSNDIFFLQESIFHL